MKVRSVRLFSLIGISGYLFGIMLVFPVRAEQGGNKGTAVDLLTRPYAERYPLGRQYMRTSPLFQVGKPAQQTVSQNNLTRVTGVEVDQITEGLELVLKTVAGSERLVPLILPEGNDLVIDILDATLGFSIRNGVTETNPAPGIDRITVSKAGNNSIRVKITGANQTLSAEVVSGRDDLVLSVTPQRTAAKQEADEEIEVIATGEAEDDNYYVPDAATATRTDTPIRDIPQAIQVIPEQVIKDQGVVRIEDALRNAVGVNQQVDRRSPAGKLQH